MSENGPTAAPAATKDDGADVDARLEKHIAALSTQQTLISIMLIGMASIVFFSSLVGLANPERPRFLSGADGGLYAIAFLFSLQLRGLTAVVKDLAKTVKGLV